MENRHTYTFTHQPDGKTDIDVVIVREGKNLKGRLLGFVLTTIGKGVLKTAFEKSVKAIEAPLNRQPLPKQAPRGSPGARRALVRLHVGCC